MEEGRRSDLIYRCATADHQWVTDLYSFPLHSVFAVYNGDADEEDRLKTHLVESGEPREFGE